MFGDFLIPILGDAHNPIGQARADNVPLIKCLIKGIFDVTEY